MTEGRTKIVATVGPACGEESALRAMIKAGVDVFRLNFSHGSYSQHAEYVQRIRSAADALNQPVAIMQDLQGPRIRTGPLKGGNPVELTRGSTVTLEHGDFPGDGKRLSTAYSSLAEDVTVGDRILLNDGMIELQVQGVSPPAVACEVQEGGQLGEHQGMNLPGVDLSISAPTEKDLEDLRFGAEHNLDYVALSFVRDRDDVEKLREELKRLEAGDVPIVAKIERPEAIETLGEILEGADGVMVARGDLGIEMPTEEVPRAQKRIISAANDAAVPVITATQMLESMVEHRRPTRAEASDVANAILDGTDAVMLSGETAMGQYPVESVRMMNRIEMATEPTPWTHQEVEKGGGSDKRHRALAAAACDVADILEARCIIAFTITGTTARWVSQRRPNNMIYALTPSEKTYRRLALIWGVRPIIIPLFETTDEMIQQGEKRLMELDLAQDGDAAVCVAGASTNTPGGTDMLKIHYFGSNIDE